jgi:DNA-binding NtrC family response regulator
MNGAPDWGQLALDIHLAARSGAAVLISAPADCAENVARTITAFSSTWRGEDLLVVDCRREAIRQLVAGIQHRRGAVRLRSGQDCAPGTVLLREVHALPRSDQIEIASVVGASAALPSWPRIISTSSVSLFDRVRSGAFDEQLFYRLNVVHIVIKRTQDATGAA